MNVRMLVAVFGASALATLVVTPLVRALARRLGMVATPSRDRWHEKPTALMGGVAIYAGFVLGALAAPGLHIAQLTLTAPILGIVGAATIMFLTGLADDRFRFRPATKLTLQIVAAAFALTCGVVYQLTPWPVLNILLTLFWYLGLTNALNLLDNMDGVAAGVAGIAALFLAVTFASGGRWLIASVCLALAGATTGFLPYNFHRASIFMGDSGSLLLGSVLAGLGALLPGGAPDSLVAVFFVPALIVSIPILDTSLVTLTRTLAGRPISEGGRDHTAHRLVAMGLSESQTALVLYGFAAAGGGVALALRESALGYGLWLGLLFLVGLLLFAAYLTRLHTYTPEEAAATPRLTLLVSNLVYKRRVLQLVIDAAIFVCAYYGAFLLRYDAPISGVNAALLERSLALVIATKVVAFSVLGAYRGMWQFASVGDLHRVLRSSAVASLLIVAVLFLLNHGADVSRGVIVIDFLLTTVLATGARASVRSMEALRGELKSRGERVIVYGAGRRGELLIRELHANRSHGLLPVAAIDDDVMKHGALLHDVPVVGGGEQLRALVDALAARRIVVAADLPPQRLAAVRAVSRELGIELQRFGVVLASVDALEGGRSGNTARPALRVVGPGAAAAGE